MRPTYLRSIKLGLAFLSLGLFLSTSVCANALDKKEIIRQARASYYSLRSHGLVDFQASVKPNWEVVLKEQMQSNPAGAQAALKLLNGLHFVLSMDASGNVKVDHSTDAPPPNEQVATGFNQIYSGMDQALSGFFQSWSPFVLTTPFPAVEGEYQLEDLGGEYKLSYKDGNADVVTRMNKDLLITAVTVNSPEFLSSVKPEFARTPKGFVLTGYSADYQPVSGKGVVQLNVQLEYNEVNGLQLPSRLKLDSVYDGAPTQMELAFAGYKVTTK